MTSLTFVSMFNQFYAIFYKPSTTPDYRRIARNFHRGKTTTKYQHLSIMPLVLEASSIKRAFIWRFFPEQLCSNFSRKQKVYFH